MFAFAYMIHLLAHELSGLCRGRLPFTRILLGALDGFFVWHGLFSTTILLGMSYANCRRNVIIPGLQVHDGLRPGRKCLKMGPRHDFGEPFASSTEELKVI